MNTARYLIKYEIHITWRVYNYKKLTDCLTGRRGLNSIYPSWSNTCLSVLPSALFACLHLHGMGIKPRYRQWALKASLVYTYVRAYVLHRAHEPRSTCNIDLVKTKLLLRASCMRQGRPRREDPSSELIRLTLFCSSITTWLNNYRVEIPVLQFRWHYADVWPESYRRINSPGNAFDDHVQTRLLCRFPMRSEFVKHSMKYISQSHVRPWDWKSGGNKRVSQERSDINWDR